MSQKLCVDGFQWVKDISSINKKLKKFIKLAKNYDEDSDKGHILDVDVKYPKKINFYFKRHNFHRSLQFLPNRMKIRKVM